MDYLNRRDSSPAVALVRAAALCFLCAWTGLALAAPPAQVWHAVGDRTLDAQRGGFFLGGGLEVSFGITRSVFINGALITETTLNLGRVADMTPAWAARLREELQSLRLVQNGPGNTFVSGPSAAASGGNPGAVGPTSTTLSGAAKGTVIQNSLNNQQILHQTIINASSNSLGLLRLSSLHSSLSEAIRQSVGQR